MNKRICSVLLMLCLVLCMFPVSARAEDGTLLQAGDHIYLGEYTDTLASGEPYTTPVCWLVLDPTIMNTGEPGVFLLTQYIVQRAGVVFNPDLSIWKDSLAQQWCTDFAAAAFTDAERALIPAVSKKEEPLQGYGLLWTHSDLEEEQVFFISVPEAMRYIGPTDGSEGLSAFTEDGVAVYWWLRTTHFSHPDYAGLVLQDNQVHDHLVNYGWGARPASNLDLSKAILLIPAEGQPSLGTLAPVSRPADGSWKLIVPDESRQLELTGADMEGNSLRLSYSGAAVGEDEYLSLLIRDADGATLSWGRLCRTEQASGELSVDLGSLHLPEGAQLFLFSEHEGGDRHSNYASPLCPVSCRLRLEPGAGGGEAQTALVPLGLDVSLPECSFTPPAGQCFDHWELDGAALDAEQSYRFTQEKTLTAVYRDIPVSEIRLSPNSLHLSMLEQAQVSAALLPEGAAYTALTWRSSSPLVLQTDQSGRLRALLPGTALLTVSSPDSGVSARMSVYVSANPTLVTPLIALPLLLLLLLVILLIRRACRRK